MKWVGWNVQSSLRLTLPSSEDKTKNRSFLVIYTLDPLKYLLLSLMFLTLSLSQHSMYTLDIRKVKTCKLFQNAYYLEDFFSKLSAVVYSGVVR